MEESKRIFDYLCDQFDETALPAGVKQLRDSIKFTSSRDAPYFPIPFKETETTAALKAVEGAVACLLADSVAGESQTRKINVDLEKTTAFLCQAYMAKVGGLGKLDPGVKAKLKGQSVSVKDSLLLEETLKIPRHRSAASTIQPISPHVGESL